MRAVRTDLTVTAEREKEMKKGYFGQYGGRFVPETLMPALIELEQAYLEYRKDKDFQKELAHLQKTYIGRPTALYFAKRFTEHIEAQRYI